MVLCTNDSDTGRRGGGEWESGRGGEWESGREEGTLREGEGGEGIKWERKEGASMGKG